jgi:hypothetical protein
VPDDLVQQGSQPQARQRQPLVHDFDLLPVILLVDRAVVADPAGSCLLLLRQREYQSECGDQRVQKKHCVEVQWWRQAGHTTPVSKVFHECPHVQNQRSSLRGDQPQSGHRM